MRRFAQDYLNEWKTKTGRKPLVIRGARQVGKSYLVRMFGESAFENTVELNFEKSPEMASLFTSREPARIVQFIEAQYKVSITPGKTLLFLDEIQAAPEVFATLRYFFEELPQLHVIAAGSLLELALDDQDFAVPVGRIEYLYLGPMQFEEFLAAAGEDRLAALLAAWSVGDEIPAAVHAKLMGLFRQFMVVGGMPAAVAAFVGDGSWRASDEVKHSILGTFREDFGKYGRRVRHQRVDMIFRRLPALVGSRFKYANVDRNERSADLAAALNLLCLARVAHKVRHSPANGVPLGYQASETNFKPLFLDIGLMNSALGLSLLDYEAVDVMLVHAGAACEQVVGQHLLYSQPPYQEPELYFWSREKAGSAAEVDYVLSQGARVVPVEVKAGATGRLKSLHVLLREKNLNFAIRINGDMPSMLDAETSLVDGGNVPFRLLSIPLYLVGQVRRLITTSVPSGQFGSP